MRKLIVSLSMLVLAVTANAAIVTYGWEDGGTALGSFTTALNPLTITNSTEQAYSGSASLKIVESPTSDQTPQIYIGWVTGLSVGDTVTASIWIYDLNSGSNAFPSGRIWGHYSANADINSYQQAPATAEQNSTYSGASTWTMLSNTWTIPTGKEAFVIEARIYGSSTTEDFIYVDDISISCSNNNAVIHTAAVPEPATMLLLGLGGLLFARKK